MHSVTPGAPQESISGHGTCLAKSSRIPPSSAKGNTVNIDQASQDIRTLFDWSQGAEADATGASSVANDDLELALQLLACNPRDRQQFQAASARQ